MHQVYNNNKCNLPQLMALEMQHALCRRRRQKDCVIPVSHSVLYA